MGYSKPTLIVISGPNGAGKSTHVQAMLPAESKGKVKRWFCINITVSPQAGSRQLAQTHSLIFHLRNIIWEILWYDTGFWFRVEVER